MRLTIFILTTIFLISLINATVTCNPNYFNLNFNESDIITKTTQCTNNNNDSITISKTGDYFTLSDTVIGPSPSTKTLTLNFRNDITAGSYYSQISFSDNTLVPVVLNVYKKQVIQNSIIVFPTAKVVNIQQGSDKQQNIQVIVPSTYPDTITIQSVNFNPDIDIVSFGDLDLGRLSPGQTLNIPIKISAKNVQTGTYSTQVNILATDSKGQLNIPTANLQVVVSVGVNPIAGENMTKPTCTLSSTEYNTNNTYTFTCSNAIENIEVSPQYNEYIEGIKADYSGGIYTYTFRAIKIGNSKFISTFNYKGSPIFTPFAQDFKVTPSGNSPVSGTVLKVLFYQEGIKRDFDKLNYGITNIVIVDNKTDSIVDNCKLYLGGLETTNKSISIEPEKTYDLRVTSPGFLDLSTTFEANIQKVQISVKPEKSLYQYGEYINITTIPINATILFDDVIVNYPYSLQKAGNITIKAVMEDYESGTSSVNVDSQLYVKTCSLENKDWKKNKEVFCDLSKTAEWEVYKGNTLLTEGNSDKVNFKIGDYDTYSIKVNGQSLYQNTFIKVSDWYNPLTWAWVKSLGYWWLLIIGLLIIILLYIRNSNSSNINPYSQ